MTENEIRMACLSIAANSFPHVMSADKVLEAADAFANFVIGPHTSIEETHDAFADFNVEED
jgi:hypothetical protein